MTPRSLGWHPPESRGRAPHAGVRTGAPGGFAALRPEVLLEHLPPVYDQGSVGSCTAQALACAVEALLPRAGYAAERPNRAALYRRERDMIGTPYEDSGAILADGVEVLRLGWELEPIEPSPFFDRSWREQASALPATAPRLVSAEALDFDALTIATELDAGHVVVVGLSVTEQWTSAFGADALPDPGGRVIGGHAVALVGYRVDAGRVTFRVRNSWGESWGRNGYAWLPSSWVEMPWCGEAHALRAVRRAQAL